MKGFVVFEVAKPVRWKPTYNRFVNIRRVKWLWLAVSLVVGMTIAEYCTPAPELDEDEKEIWFI